MRFLFILLLMLTNLLAFDIKDTNNYWVYLALDIPEMIVLIKALIGLSLFTIFITFIYKFYVEAEKRKIHFISLQLKEAIEHLIETNNYSIFNIRSPKTTIEYFAFVNVIIYFILKYKNKSEFLLDLLEEKGVISYLKKVAANKLSYNRVQAIEKLSLLHDNKLKGFLFQIVVNENHKRSKEHAFTGVSHLVRKDDLPYVLSEFVKLKSSGKFLEYLFSNMIKSLQKNNEESGVFDILYYFFNIKGNEKLLKSFVEAIGYLKVDLCSDEFYDLYFMAQTTELKIAIIRTIGLLKQSEKADEAMIFALHSPKEIIRVSAAKNLNIMDFDKYKDFLKTILTDDNYTVRLNSALSLGQTNKGKQMLSEIYETSDDNYAKEMAKYALIVNERRLESKPILKNWREEDELEKMLEEDFK